ncbi:carboxypeptidase family protein [Lacibacter cauensis]|uniref:Carboxypeptidase family protein n=1 Tax=Lacibacter cauensis TaxID=510947 RepID=A0A562SQB5_9BACT|nr:carboxypeptidase-like regulatory domain-containing protein [Lacibacter cauensis]TWI82970.1 carboxypeptidase family protein [Lacibacter cauensis]
MNARQESKLSMYNAVLTHIEANPAITATVPAFATVATALRTVYNNIITAAQKEAQATAGITMDKAGTKTALCEEAANIAAAVFAFAMDANNHELKEQVNYPVSKLQQTKDELLVPLCNNIHAKATANIAALASFGITAGRLTAFQTTIDNYAALIPGPRNAVANRAAARATLTTLFKQADEMIKLQMDKLALQFKPVNSAFYSAFKTNRSIIDATSTSTMVKGKVVDMLTNLPVPSVAVQVVGQAYAATTNANGEYEVKIPVPGVYNLSYSNNGYNNKTENNINVSLGQVTTRNTQMAPL